MKNMKKIYPTLLMLSLGLGFSPVLPAQEQEATDPEICVVQEERDVQGVGGRGISLRRAINLANDLNVDRRRCTKGILLEGFANMDMAQMLVLQFRTAGVENEYVFGGADADNPVTLDFQSLGPSADASRYCDFIVKETNYLKIQNLRIKNAQSSGICLGGINGSVSNVTLDNVVVENAEGHGIIVRAGSTKNLILPNSEVRDTGQDAVHLEGTSIQDFNFIRATNRPVTGADADGLSILGSQSRGQAVENFTMLSIGSEKFVTSPRQIRVRVDSVDEIVGTTRFRVRGWIVDADPEAENICDARPHPDYLSVERIQIYSVKPSINGFYKYIERRGETTGANGIDLREGNPGKFRFEIDKSVVGDLIVLVPEMQEETMAGASAIVSLTDGAGECETGGGGLGGDGVTGLQLWSKAHCAAVRGRGGPGGAGQLDPQGLDEEFDSDGDLLADVYEDTDGDCEYNNGDFSNWMDPDTDGDGILDGKESPQGLVPYNVFDNPRPGGTSAEKFCTPGDEPDPCDTDGDHDSNPRDDDDDNDGLATFIEDRRRTINQLQLSVITYKGTEYPCTLGTNRMKGIDWNIYRVVSAGTEPELYGIEESTLRDNPEDGSYLVPLACKNKSLERFDFNGNHEGGRGETDALHPDTDRDGWCDGEGEDCRVAIIANFQGKGDNCPNDPVSDNECSRGCIQSEDLYRVCANDASLQCAGLFLEMDAADDREPVGLKFGDNSVPDLFEVADFTELYSVCEDADGDTIPDCVERMNPRCDLTIEARGSLNPFKQDTDGDGIEDHIDINPFADVGGDEVEDTIDDVSDANREELRTVLRIAQIPFLSCFVDRDQDGLNDCQEDLNHNDEYNSTTDFAAFMTALAAGSYVESDPLNPDSDLDELDDKLERDTLATNPANPDTDGDYLSDRVEIIGSARGDYAPRAGTQCAGLNLIDPGVGLVTGTLRAGTNPTAKDTDNDGIEDGQELRGDRVGPIPFPEILIGILGGFDLISDPLAQDSDNDGLSDGAEYGTDGIMKHSDTNPCDENTDDDSFDDGEPQEAGGCGTIDDERCQPSERGRDFDSDGLTDFEEDQIGSDPRNPDTDGDGLLDGQEDIIPPFGEIQTHLGDTDPLNPDTDGDGLRDGIERQYGIYPNVVDTDADCIPDGVEVNFKETSTFSGTDTDPTNPDSDGDGLCDGNNSHSNGGIAGDVSCFRGEDLNCNGLIDTDPEFPEFLLETDPRLADTDQDGIDDRTEICTGGQCNFAANIGHATLGAPSGCFSLSPVAPFGSSSMLYVYGLLLMLNRIVRKKLNRQ